MDPRPWHALYPPGVPLEAPLEPGLTVPVAFARTARRWPGRAAFTCLGARLDYAALDSLSRDFAAALHRLGLVPGDRVALMLPNGLPYPVGLLGTMRAGMTVVSVNPLYTARELAHQLKDSGASAIFCAEAALPTVRAVAAETALRHVVYASAAELLPPPGAEGRPFEPDTAAPTLDGALPFAALLALGHEGPWDEPPLAADAPAFLQYTGGTTGVSKGAVLTHAGVLAAAQQQLAWNPSVYLDGDTSCVTPLPLYHIYPINILLILWLVGGTNRLVPNPRDLDQVFAELARAPLHLLLGVNTLFVALLASGRLRKADFAAARIVHSAGAAGQQAVADRWQEATGIRFTESYGLTECSPGVCSSSRDAHWPGSIGVPVPGTDVMLIDGDGRRVPPNVPGELCVKGPQVFGGYWQRPEETRKAFTDDGWLRTGDVATMDEAGRFSIVDRLKDMILVSGFNVYPNEIEAVVAMLPEVLECACIGVPDDKSGEAPRLYVVKRDAALDEARVAAHCRAHLTAYKQPRRIVFVDALPKSPVGKILRRELRAAGG